MKNSSQKKNKKLEKNGIIFAISEGKHCQSRSLCPRKIFLNSEGESCGIHTRNARAVQHAKIYQYNTT